MSAIAEKALSIHESLQNETNLVALTAPLVVSPDSSESEIRPNSVSVEDTGFGDTGKGQGTIDFGVQMLNDRGLFTARYNGGGNAGHEINIYGKTLATHQLPVGIALEGAVAAVTRGQVFNPGDAVQEKAEVEEKLGSKLPGKLIIDDRTPLALDVHKAWEYVVKTQECGGEGSTGQGISPAYAEFYLRNDLTVKDLMATDNLQNWKDKFRRKYEFYEKAASGFGLTLADITIGRFGEGKQPLGSVDEYLDRLLEARAALEPFVVDNFREIGIEAWKNSHMPFLIEGAQGVGLDPRHGVRPDVTASRAASRYIMDGLPFVDPNRIEIRAGVMKTLYQSSVGTRRLPRGENDIDQERIREAYNEYGRTTKRPREIYPISIPLLRKYKAAAGFEYLVATHLDSSIKGDPIHVVTHYTDKETGEETEFGNYQDEIDRLQAHTMTFEGWDGEAASHAKRIEDLPREALIFLGTIAKVTGTPIAMATAGPGIDNYINVAWRPRKAA